METAVRATEEQLKAVKQRIEKSGKDGAIYYRTGCTFLYYSFYLNGKQKQFNSKTHDVEEAYRLLLDAQSQTNRGTVVLPEEAGRITYEQMRDRYKNNEEKLKRARNEKIKHLDKFFGGMRITRIDADVLVAYRQKRKKEGVKGPTIRRELGILRTMFNELRKAKKISADQVPHFDMPKDSKPAGTYIEPEQFAEILTHLPDGKLRQADDGGPSSVSNLQPFFKFIYATGCRLGCAQQLTWKMLKEFDGVLFLEVPGELTKNGEPISLPLTGLLDPEAEELRSRRRELEKEFRNFDNDFIFDSTNYRPEWAKACAKAGVGTWDQETRTRTGVRIHDCRASAAINLLGAGVEEALVLKIGGWQTRAMLDRYVGAGAKNRKKLIEAMQKGGNYVNSLMKKAQNQ